MSGQTIGWDTTDPADSKNLGLGAGDIRSFKTNVEGGLGAEHLWPSSGPALAGVHLAGSARAFVGTLSQVSSADTTGRLMATSDKTSLYYVGSDTSWRIGGQNSVQAAVVKAPVFPLLQSGSTSSTWIAGAATVTFPSAYSVAPNVVASIQPQGSSGGDDSMFVVNIYSVAATEFNFTVHYVTANGIDPATINAHPAVSTTVQWMSFGTRTVTL